MVALGFFCTCQLPRGGPSTTQCYLASTLQACVVLPLLQWFLTCPHLPALYRKKGCRWGPKRATHLPTHTLSSVTLRECWKHSQTKQNATNSSLHTSDVNACTSCHGEKTLVEIIAVNLRGWCYFYTPSWRNHPQQTFSPSRFIFKVFKSRICHIHCRKAGLMKTESAWCNVYRFFFHNSLAYQKPPYNQGISSTHIHTSNPAWHPTLTVPVLGWALVISVCLLCRHVFTAHRPCFLPVSAEGWWISNSVSPCGQRSLHPPVPLLPHRQQAFGTNL